MKRIQQRLDNDCALACAAMVLDWTYDQVAAAVDDQGLELHPEEGVSVTMVLRACGYDATCCEGFYLPDDKPVILILPSASDPAYNHAVVCFNAKLFDPSDRLLRRRSALKAVPVTRFTVYGIRRAA